MTSHRRRSTENRDAGKARKVRGTEGDSRNQSIYSNLLSLPNSMSSIHSLSIVRRVPIVVIYSSALLWVHHIEPEMLRVYHIEHENIEKGRWRVDRRRNRRREGNRDDVQKITVSAAVKLIPNPPALVERQKTKISGLFVSSVLGF